MEELKALKKHFFDQLDERQKRLYAALEATEKGHYGVTETSELFGLHANTIRQGKKDLLSLKEELLTEGKMRISGGGRKKNK